MRLILEIHGAVELADIDMRRDPAFFEEASYAVYLALAG
jgi:hypothetical protein